MFYKKNRNKGMDRLKQIFNFIMHFKKKPYEYIYEELLVNNKIEIMDR